jgi:drug/metabolite transporter (DMT)-like permease
MNFKKVNNITGWVVCAIASLVYILTAEKSGSFWDCGEFVSAAYKLQLPHPPGAPVFTLFGRFFIILFGDDPMTAAKAVNIMNALASGFTILFLFWTITHFARKLMVGFIEEPVGYQVYTIMGAGVVGALAYTFSDSFWFSAVEGEVYALSSFFTGLVFWAMLKWERADVAAGADRLEKNHADRWIVFIAFMMGLSIGVHLLNLLTIPAIVMIYYYRRYNYTRKGAIWAFILGCAITGVVQLAVIQWTVKFAGKFDILFVNGFGLPFFSGFIFFFLLLGFLIWWGMRVAKRKGWSFLRLGLWSFTFMLLGYSTYVTTLERSSANPALDMNNVDNPMSLNYYLGREQYGSQPLIYGPHFQADYKRDESGQVVFTEGEMKYTKGKDHYIETGKSQEPEFDSKDMMLFPRIWDRSNDQNHAEFYADWLGLEKQTNPQTGEQTYEKPTYGDNIKWFFTYQMGFMYWRYFMWNFAGKQNDVQGFGNKRDGNWVSGIQVIDNMRLGDQSKMPDSLQHNKAKNHLFLLPFLLGIFGCVYHFLKDRRDWIISFLLFFFTGIAIVLYLNQPGNQPRERDYAYAGSFYAYAIWIGLSVIGFVRLARERSDKLTLTNCLIYGGLLTFLITWMSNANTTPGAAFGSALIAAVLYALVIAIIYLIVRVIAGNGLRMPAATAIAFLLCLSAPVVMGKEEWNDHDRSKKTLAPSMAKDYLESCAKNAILFTFGDNDTYPLWYAQEVEGVRPDIRIINTSLLGIDWYVNQLRYKVNESDPINVLWTPEQIAGLSYISFRPEGDQVNPRPLLNVMRDEIGPQLNNEDKTSIQATYPTRHFIVPVDTAGIRANGLALSTDSVYTQFRFDIAEGRNYMTLDQLTILNIIAANGWKRPIYFTSPYGDLGFAQYLRKDGLTYRLVPVKSNLPVKQWVVDQAFRSGGKNINTENMKQVILNKFQSGGANLHGIYFDEENRRHLLSLRSVFAEAAGTIGDLNQKADAVKILDRSESLILPENLPYAMASRYSSHNQVSLTYLEAAFKAGDMPLADKLEKAIRKDLTDQKNYYTYLQQEKPEFYDEREAYSNNAMMEILDFIVKTYKTTPPPLIMKENPRKTADTVRRQ